MWTLLSPETTNGSDITNVTFPTGSVQIFTAVAMAGQLLANLPISILLCYLILAREDLRKPVNYIVFSCVLSEALAMFQWGLSGVYMFISQIELACATAAYILCASALSAFASYSLVGIERYMALYHPLRCEDIFTSRNTIAMLVAAWLAAVLLVAPLHGLLGYDATGSHTCNVILKDVHIGFHLYYAVGYCCAFPTYAVLVVCNVMVSQRLAMLKRQLAASNVKSSKLEHGNFENITRLLRVYIVTPGFFMLPSILLKVIGPRITADVAWLGRPFYVLHFCYECIMPYCIIYFLGPFRKAVTEFFVCGRRQGHVHPVKHDSDVTMHIAHITNHA